MEFRFLTAIAVIVFMVALPGAFSSLSAAEAPTVMEQAMSDTLDLWREGRYEQLFEHLAHRGKTSRELFVRKMHDTSTRPACCWQKMENFKVLNEKRTEATVYVKLGLEGVSPTSASSTREFKLTHEEGIWKMQLADVFSIAGVTGKKSGGSKRYNK